VLRRGDISWRNTATLPANGFSFSLPNHDPGGAEPPPANGEAHHFSGFRSARSLWCCCGLFRRSDLPIAAGAAKGL